MYNVGSEFEKHVFTIDHLYMDVHFSEDGSYYCITESNGGEQSPHGLTVHFRFPDEEVPVAESHDDKFIPSPDSRFIVVTDYNEIELLASTAITVIDILTEQAMIFDLAELSKQYDVDLGKRTRFYPTALQWIDDNRLRIRCEADFLGPSDGPGFHQLRREELDDLFDSSDPIPTGDFVFVIRKPRPHGAMVPGISPAPSA